MSVISETILPVTHDLGAFAVRRILPSRKRAMVGPFIFVDAFGPAELEVGADMGVRPHPHIGLATVTYLFAGAVDHRDSLGTFQTIYPGEVNLMTAGKGIVHSERSPESEIGKISPMFGMQTWLALPDGKEEIDPAFENVGADALPLIEDAGTSARVIMGDLWGQSAPTTCHSPTIYADIMLGAGGTIPIDSDADERALVLVEGDVAIAGMPMEMFTLYILAPGEKPKLESISGGRAMLLGGAPIGSSRHIWWNFVSSSNERIKQAQADWNAGRFPKVPGDEEEFIPIPDVPLTRGQS
ncbi:pirin family protein [Alterisphingorhabdus coralli]|uniref:Pirin family protein n=1 Tax=Alterisphingorhabdus coralli TaxID=3071408 RepID=A0AA97F9X3_9SPHN|nr:pirin family protein [Parasphingorhabdus sp. SCSIO 66989]WOE75878.1 pirin family protein [Parasphingorhabdus sp. SCSIO 66989]